MLQWASDEDEHCKELYTRLTDLDALYASLFKRYAQQIESARQCYKAIAKGEKQVQELKREYETQQAKANKFRKQVLLCFHFWSLFNSIPNSLGSNEAPWLFQAESTRKKKEKDKVIEAVEMELATAYSQETKAADDLRSAKENHSKFKVSEPKKKTHVNFASRPHAFTK